MSIRQQIEDLRATANQGDEIMAAVIAALIEHDALLDDIEPLQTMQARASATATMFCAAALAALRGREDGPSNADQLFGAGQPSWHQ